MVASCFELIGIGQQGLHQSGSEKLRWMASVFVVANVLQVELCTEFAVQLLVLVLQVQQLLAVSLPGWQELM